eukprot:1240129-Rhodomonas_salina.2
MCTKGVASENSEGRMTAVRWEFEAPSECDFGRSPTPGDSDKPEPGPGDRAPFQLSHSMTRTWEAQALERGSSTFGGEQTMMLAQKSDPSRPLVTFA